VQVPGRRRRGLSAIPSFSPSAPPCFLDELLQRRPDPRWSSPPCCPPWPDPVSREPVLPSSGRPAAVTALHAAAAAVGGAVAATARGARSGSLVGGSGAPAAVWWPSCRRADCGSVQCGCSAVLVRRAAAAGTGGHYGSVSLGYCPSPAPSREVYDCLGAL